MKQLSRAEMIAFLKFAPHYFRHLSNAIFGKVMRSAEDRSPATYRILTSATLQSSCRP